MCRGRRRYIAVAVVVTTVAVVVACCCYGCCFSCCCCNGCCCFCWRAAALQEEEEEEGELQNWIGVYSTVVVCVVRILHEEGGRKEAPPRSYSSHRVSAAMMNTVSKWESRVERIARFLPARTLRGAGEGLLQQQQRQRQQLQQQ